MTNKINKLIVNKQPSKTTPKQEKHKHTGNLPSGTKIEKKHHQDLNLSKQNFNKVVGELKDKFENKSNKKTSISQRQIQHKEKSLSIEEKGQIFQKNFEIVTEPKNTFENRAKALLCLLAFRNDEDRTDDVDEALNGIIEDLRDAYDSETLEGQKNENLSDDARLYNVYQSFESKAKQPKIEEVVIHQRESLSKKPLEYVTHEHASLRKQDLPVKETPKNQTSAIKNQFETFLESVLADPKLSKEETQLARSAKKLIHKFDLLSHSYKGMVEELKKLPLDNLPGTKATQDNMNFLIKSLVEVAKDPVNVNVERLRNSLNIIGKSLLSKTGEHNPHIKEAYDSLKKVYDALLKFDKSRDKTWGLKIADKATIDKLKKEILIAKLQYFGLETIRWGSMLLLAAACVAIIALAILFSPLVLIAWPVTGILSAIITLIALRFGEDKFKDIEHAYRMVEYRKEELEKLEEQLKNSNEQQVQLRKFIQKLNKLSFKDILTLKANPKQAEQFIKATIKTITDYPRPYGF